MKSIIKISFVALSFTLLASCGNNKSNESSVLKAKKEQLAKLKEQAGKTNDAIKKLETEIAKLDTTSVNNAALKLVALQALEPTNFEHYIKLQGSVDAYNISYITPRTGGGQVKAVYVKQGDRVHKGQLLLKLDDAIMRQQVATAKQQAGSIMSQLGLAKTVYQRTKNLWDQGIGTEVNLIQTKTNVTTLESQLAQVNAQVKLAQTQLNTSNVYSDVTGVANIVNIRVGETFTGMSAAGPQIEIVNNSELKVVSTIPENYLSAVHKGTQVLVDFPDLNKTITSSVSFVGAAIDPNTRGFVVEAKLPSSTDFKPNQVATVRFKDYTANNTIVIPLNTLQSDANGNFVYIAVKQNGSLVAKKCPVIIGKLNDASVEIKSGLNKGDVLITEGYSGLYEGQALTTAS